MLKMSHEVRMTDGKIIDDYYMIKKYDYRGMPISQLRVSNNEIKQLKKLLDKSECND